MRWLRLVIIGVERAMVPFVLRTKGRVKGGIHSDYYRQTPFRLCIDNCNNPSTAKLNGIIKEAMHTQI